MKRQILKDFELTEISGVDKPAQPTAKVSIMKSAKSDAGDSGKINKTESPDMTDKVAELEKSLNDMKATLEKAVADKAAAEAVAKLSDAEKEFVAKMGDKDKEGFMAMSDEDKKKKMAAMKKNDETIVVNGQTISKSAVGDGMFEVLKAQEKANIETLARLEKAEKDAFTARLEKRVETEFAYIAGDTLTKVAMLAEIEKMDEKTKAFAFGILKAQNDFAKEAATVKGSSVNKSKDVDVTAKIAEIQKRDNVSKSKAMEIFAIENPELVAE